NWFMQGQAPASVTCLTQNIKPELYPKVDDDALIILNYPQTQVIIQASWSWSHNRKDMEVYGTTGYLHALNGKEMMVQVNEKEGAKKQLAMPLPKNRFDPFAYLTSVVRGKIDPQPYDLSALENNLMVMQILELAKKSAKEGKTMIWEEWY
ncbi:MAG: gfo/Idh/MocA family oxidoreductase, partial [Bacteroidota bacterium]